LRFSGGNGPGAWPQAEGLFEIFPTASAYQEVVERQEAWKYISSDVSIFDFKTYFIEKARYLGLILQ